MKANDILFCVKSGPGGSGKGVRWFRTKLNKIRPDSSWYMSTSSKDGLRFRAQRDVMILGYGATGPKASEHESQLTGWSTKIYYKVNDGEKSEEVIFTAEEPAEIEGAEVNLFDIYFSDIGLDKVELKEGEFIDICQTLNSGPNHFNYISGGDYETYSKIEGQECDFKTEYSSLDSNGTDSSTGMYAYLIYRPL